VSGLWPEMQDFKAEKSRHNLDSTLLQRSPTGFLAGAVNLARNQDAPSAMDMTPIFLILRPAANRLSNQMRHLFKPAWLRLLFGGSDALCRFGARSADWQSAVSRIGNPQAPSLLNAGPTASRRHRRLTTCVTQFMESLVLLAVLMAMWTVGSIAGAETAPTNQWLIPFDLTDSSPAIGPDGTIYLGSLHQKFWAVDSNGVIRWQFKTGSEIKSSPAIGDDGTIYFGCRDRKLYAVSPKGKKKWAFPTGAWVDSSPALGRDGTIYFGSWDKYFYALNPDGTLKWKFETGGEIDSSPAVGADETIYFGSHDKKFYALAPDGKKRWEYQTGGPIISSPALNGTGVVYFTSVDGFCYALNADGSLRWRLKTGGTTESSPVIGEDGTIYVGVNFPSLWAIDPDGKKKWEKFGVDFGHQSAAMVVPGSIYVVGRAALLALDTEGGLKWQFDLHPQFDPLSAVAADGILYVTCQGNCLAALDTHAPLAPTTWPKFRANARNTGHSN
jgi:outer membrane protein assembly factor BamB